MTLTTSERNSAVWLKLLKHFHTRRDELRAKNDAPLDSTATAEMRGRIAEVKALILLDQDIPIIEQ